MSKFYDTSSLLIAGNEAFNEEFYISSITLKELENIKTSNKKDADIKHDARIVTSLINQHPDLCHIIIHRPSSEMILTDIEITDDTKILSDAVCTIADHEDDNLVFVTNDLSQKNIASLFFTEDSIQTVQPKEDNYTGYKIISATDDELAHFYENPSENKYNLYVGQYLIIQDLDNQIVDVRCWTGEEHRYLNYHTFDSKWFGKIAPFQEDIFQKLAFDSMSNNQVTMVRGPAGSGKTLISLGRLMSQLEKGRIDQIIIFCNTVATANSARLGFLPGTRDEKLLDSQIGNLLSSKLGGKEGVLHLVESGKLLLLPLSDIRGFDTSGMNAGIYLSEAQNLDRTLMKLALQRIGEDSICIIDGDDKTQVDMEVYAGRNNGMKRASKVLRGKDFYGEVQLSKIYRSKLAEAAELI